MRKLRLGHWTLSILLVLTAGLVAGCNGPSRKPASPAIDARAAEILREMSNRLAGSKTLTIRGRRKIDAALLEGREVVEQADVTVSVSRPNKAMAVVDGPDDGRRMYYDGATFSLHNVGEKVYGAVPYRGDLDGLLDMIEEKLGVTPPLAEFLRADPYAALTSHARTGWYVGEEMVRGKAVHHLSFAEETVEWDLWVGVANRLPMRLMARATAMEGDPAIEVEFDEVVLGPPLDDAIFVFTPPAEVERLKMVSSESLEAE